MILLTAEIRRSPVEVGKLSHYLSKGAKHHPTVGWWLGISEASTTVSWESGPRLNETRVLKNPLTSP